MATNNNNNSNSNGNKKKRKKKRPYNNNKKKKKKAEEGQKKAEEEKQRKKEIVAKAAAELRKQRKANKSNNNNNNNKSSNNNNNNNDRNVDSTSGNDDDDGLLDTLNPFRAGQKLRQTLESLSTSLGGGLSEEQKNVYYYLDDRLSGTNQNNGGGLSLAERNPTLDRQANDVPEVLVVGATGEVGRLLVRQLLLQGRVRVRVLVRDLFSKTLNLLGTGVTYCQGDLHNIESLEYAVTDVDKIIFCAGAPKPDEPDFRDKFQKYFQETVETTTTTTNPIESISTTTKSDNDDNNASTSMELDWDKAESELEARSKLAQLVDLVGMQNVVRAFQNVRYADFGSSQTAKRSLFKFQSRPEDFFLFAIDDEDDDDDDDDDNVEEEEYVSENELLEEEASGWGEDDSDEISQLAEAYAADSVYNYEEEQDDDYDDDEDNDHDYDDDNEYESAKTRRGSKAKSQCVWMKNKFEHAVFVGRVSRGIAGLAGEEASVVSSRLRSRDNPESGIDLSKGFGGFVCRLCADGGNYEAFVRTGTYETDGIEYVCGFGTATKTRQNGNKSSNKFVTKRLAFENFKPVLKRRTTTTTNKNPLGETTMVPPFRGSDVRQIGFRYRYESNQPNTPSSSSSRGRGEFSNFYLALSYIKVYRSQPEPEFVYLSDAKIPPNIQNSMVRHDIRQLVDNYDDDSNNSNNNAPVQLFDEAKIKSATVDKGRSSEETYFKYRGEEILKSSGLNYAIIRVSGYNESPSAEASTVELKPVSTQRERERERQVEHDSHTSCVSVGAVQ